MASISDGDDEIMQEETGKYCHSFDLISSKKLSVNAEGLTVCNRVKIKVNTACVMIVFTQFFLSSCIHCPVRRHCCVLFFFFFLFNFKTAWFAIAT